MIGHRVTAFGYSRPRRSLTGKGNLLEAKARLVANHGARAALTLQAVAHRDARRFALNRKMKLSAAAHPVGLLRARSAWPDLFTLGSKYNQQIELFHYN